MKDRWWRAPGLWRDLMSLILVCGFVWGFVAGLVPAETFAIAVRGVLGLNGAVRQADKARGEDDRRPPASGGGVG
jgi:hypothetical protein